MQVTAIIAAAGDGRRLGVRRAEAVARNRRTCRCSSAASNAFCGVDRVTEIIVVTRRRTLSTRSRAGSRPAAQAAASSPAGRRGRSRWRQRVRSRSPRTPTYVLVHDAARPFVTPALIERTIDAAIESGAAIAALPARDTVKQAARTAGGAFIAADAPARRDLSGADAAGVPPRHSARGDCARARRVPTATDEAALAEPPGIRVRARRGRCAELRR